MYNEKIIPTTNIKVNAIPIQIIPNIPTNSIVRIVKTRLRASLTGGTNSICLIFFSVNIFAPIKGKPRVIIPGIPKIKEVTSSTDLIIDFKNELCTEN